MADRPDLRFTVDGTPTACELVQIPPASVLQYVHARFRQLDGRGASAVRVVWPQEQHFWTQQAIESKQFKLTAYKRNAGVSQVSLLVHAPVDERQDWIQVQAPVTRQLLSMGAQRARHDFAAIYFWSRETGVALLSPSDGPPLRLATDLSRGYPTHGFVIGSSRFRTTEEGDDPVLFEYGDILPEVLVVPSQSPEFRNHKPNFVNPRMRMRVLAHATTAEITFLPVEGALEHGHGGA